MGGTVRSNRGQLQDLVPSSLLLFRVAMVDFHTTSSKEALPRRVLQRDRPLLISILSRARSCRICAPMPIMVCGFWKVTIFVEFPFEVRVAATLPDQEADTYGEKCA